MAEEDDVKVVGVGWVLQEKPRTSFLDDGGYLQTTYLFLYSITAWLTSFHNTYSVVSRKSPIYDFIKETSSLTSLLWASLNKTHIQRGVANKANTTVYDLKSRFYKDKRVCKKN